MQLHKSPTGTILDSYSTWCHEGDVVVEISLNVNFNDGIAPGVPCVGSCRAVETSRHFHVVVGALEGVAGEEEVVVGLSVQEPRGLYDLKVPEQSGHQQNLCSTPFGKV